MADTAPLTDPAALSTDHLPDIVYLVDVEEQRNVFVNKTIETVLLYTPEDIAEMGSNLFPTIIHPDDMPRVGAHYERLPDLGDGHSAIVEYRVRRKDGVYVWYRSTDTIYQRKPDGTPKLLLGSAYDITLQKEREETIALLNRELAHRVQNLFSVNLSLVRQARRRGGSLETVLDDLEQRIAAMGAVQGQVRGNGQKRNRDLRKMVEDVFAVLAKGRQMDVDIGAIAISEAQLNSIGIILYELFVASTLRAQDVDSAVPLRIEATQEDGMVTLVWQDRLDSEPFQSAAGQDALRLVRLATGVIQGTLDLGFDAPEFTATLRFPMRQTIAPVSEH